MQPDSACHSSTALEKVLEHLFVAGLLTELWTRGMTDIGVAERGVQSRL